MFIEYQNKKGTLSGKIYIKTDDMRKHKKINTIIKKMNYSAIFI